jgi:hypothetical protein
MEYYVYIQCAPNVYPSFLILEIKGGL